MTTYRVVRQGTRLSQFFSLLIREHKFYSKTCQHARGETSDLDRPLPNPGGGSDTPNLLIRYRNGESTGLIWQISP